MNFIDLLNIKEDTLKNDGNQFLVPIDSSYSVFFHTMEVMGPSNCLITSIVPNILFCIQQQKKSHTGLEQQHNFIFYGELFL